MEGVNISLHRMATMADALFEEVSTSTQTWGVIVNDSLWDLRDTLLAKGVPLGLLREEFGQFEALIAALAMLLLPLCFAVLAVHCLQPAPKPRLKKQLSIQNIDRAIKDVWSPGKELEVKKEELVERLNRVSARARAALETPVEQTPKRVTRGVYMLLNDCLRVNLQGNQSRDTMQAGHRALLPRRRHHTRRCQVCRHDRSTADLIHGTTAHQQQMSGCRACHSTDSARAQRLIETLAT